MDARERGRRRITAVTVGLAAASLAGTMAVAAAAYARSNTATDPDGTTGGTSGGTIEDETDTGVTDEWTPPPGGVADPDSDEPPHATSAGT